VNPGRRARARGFSLVELLVASAITSIVLAGAWPWLWNVAEASRVMGARAQGSTAGAFALRVIGDDLAQAVALGPTPAGRSPHTALSVTHVHPGEAPEIVAIVWDASRRILWRKTSSSYLADQVQSFDVRYFSATGVELTDADFTDAGWPARVARLAVTVRVGGPTRAETASLQAVLRAS
jgi:prepilin-type N-terminal cleavage/methylation domain-containing protein